MFKGRYKSLDVPLHILAFNHEFWRHRLSAMVSLPEVFKNKAWCAEIFSLKAGILVGMDLHLEDE